VNKKLRKIKKKKIVDKTGQQRDINLPLMQRPQTIPRVNDPTYNYSSTFDGGRRSRTSFNPPEYNLAEVGRITDIDGYCARSFDKKLSLMFKEGWSLLGKNPKTVKYVKIRLAQIANATSMPTNDFFRKIGDGLIRKSNTFLIKVRNIEASGGKVRKLPNSKKTLKPVAGYFIPPAETMEFRMSGNRVDKWRQSMPYGQTKEFNSDNVSHFHYNKKDGFVFGTPTILPVIDDVRALRKIEENIELLVYQHLFPLFQWTVGTKEAPATTTEKGEREVDIVREEIQYLPTEGGIVTTERHQITAIGAEGRALRAEGYLTHFKRRVFSGLDMSPVDFGESESSNRSTAETLSQNLIDRVKDFQRAMEGFVNEVVIKELLLESAFGFDVLDEDNIVRFKFREIDLELQIKKENHYADLFAKNTIGLNEARIGMEREAVLLPTPEEIDNGQDGPDKYPDWYEFFWNLIERPKALIQAVDEPYSQPSKTAAAAQKNKEEELAIKRTQVEKPKTKTTKDVVFRDAFLTKQYKKAKSQIVDYISRKKETNPDFISQLIRTALTPAIDKINTEQAHSFRKGYSQYSKTKGPIYIENLSVARNKFLNRTEFYINKLIKDMSATLRRNINIEESVASTVESVFDSFKFRSNFIEDVEIRKAYFYGRAIGMRTAGIKQSIINSTDEPCDKCQEHTGEIIENRYVTLSDVPPFHNKCGCTLKSYIDQSNISDNVDELADCNNIEDKKNSAENAARKARVSNCMQRMVSILKKDNPTLDNRDLKALAKMVCLARISDEKLEDVSELEKCVLKVKKSLRKQHPDWSEKKIKSSAFAICKSR
jgi:hypothetical protein